MERYIYWQLLRVSIQRAGHCLNVSMGGSLFMAQVTHKLHAIHQS